MITLCTVDIPNARLFLEKSLKTVLEKTKLVREILICEPRQPESYYQESEVNGIPIKRFGVNFPVLDNHDLFDQSSEHALGLHECIERSKYEYILFNDPDTLWYTSVDQIYFDLLKQHDLNLVGCCKVNAATFEAAGFFPNPFSMMLCKQDLPDLNYMQNECVLRSGINMPGKILLPPLKYKDNNLDWFHGTPRFNTSDYPAPEAFYDTGSMLLRWAIDQKWKWLSFLYEGQIDNGQTYYTKWYRSNPRINKIKPTKLIYHQVSCSHLNKLSEFNNVFDNMKADEDE